MQLKRIMILGLVIVILVSCLSLKVMQRPGKAEPYGGILKAAVMEEIRSKNILKAGGDEWTWKVLSPVYDTVLKVDKVTGDPMTHILVGLEQDGNVGLTGNDRILPPLNTGFLPQPLHDQIHPELLPPVTRADPGKHEIVAYYDFTDVRFHDGTQVDIMDVIFSYHFMALHPELYSGITPLMDNGGLPGGNFSSERWLGIWDVSGEYANDGNPLTSALSFHLSDNFARLWTKTMGITIFPQHIWEGTGGGIHADFGYAIDSNGIGVPINHPTLDEFDMITKAMQWEPLDSEVIGNGPFEFVEFIPGSHTRLDTYLDYYPSRAYIDGMEFIKFFTPQQATMALKEGETDILLWSFPPDFIPDLISDPNITLVQNPDMYFSYVGFQMRIPVFGYETYPPMPGTVDTGKPLREAIAYLTNKSTIVGYYLQGNGDIAWGPVSPQRTLWYNSSLPMYNFDVELAKSILNANGYIDHDTDFWRDTDPNTPGDQDDPIEILAPTADYNPILAQACLLLETEMKDVALNAYCNHQPYGTIIDRLSVRSFEMFLFYWDDSVLDPWNLMQGDPDYMYDMFYSGNSYKGKNYVGYENSSFDNVILDSRHELDLNDRQVSIKWAQGLIAEDLPVNPLYYKTNIWAYRHDRFVNWTLLNSIFNYWSQIGVHLSESIPPTIMNLQPPDGSTIDNSTPAISANYSDDSGIDISSVVLKLDGVEVSSATVTLEGVVYTPASALDEGLHTAYIEVKDICGNLASRSWSFIVQTLPPTDTIPPTITDLKPPDESTTQDSTPIIGADYNDPSGINVSSIVLKVDSVDITSSATVTESGVVYTPTSALADGVHTVYVEVKDTKGNLATVSWSFTVDTEVMPPPKDVVAEYWWILLIAAVIIIIALVLIFLFWRRKKKTEEASVAQETEEQPPEETQGEQSNG